MNNNLSPTKQLAREIHEALENDPMTDDELFEFIVQEGIIDRNGRVIARNSSVGVPFQKRRLPRKRLINRNSRELLRIELGVIDRKPDGCTPSGFSFGRSSIRPVAAQHQDPPFAFTFLNS